jgi:hypothetical protein
MESKGVLDCHLFSASTQSEPSMVEVEIALRKLRRYKSLGTDLIPAELIKAGGETLCSDIQ